MSLLYTDTKQVKEQLHELQEYLATHTLPKRMRCKAVPVPCDERNMRAAKVRIGRVKQFRQDDDVRTILAQELAENKPLREYLSATEKDRLHSKCGQLEPSKSGFIKSLVVKGKIKSVPKTLVEYFEVVIQPLIINGHIMSHMEDETQVCNKQGHLRPFVPYKRMASYLNTWGAYVSGSHTDMQRIRKGARISVPSPDLLNVKHHVGCVDIDRMLCGASHDVLSLIC